jgi:chromosome segregation ATPase
MAEKNRRALAQTLDERRPARIDPRVEPESARAEPTDSVVRAEVRQEVRQDVTGIGATTDEFAAASGRRAPDSKSSLDSAAAAGASGMAVVRRQLATLQMQLADAQGELAREQQSRADDAEEMARVLERLATAEAEGETLQDDIERERAFVEELRVSVREKYEDCNTLRQKLADAETLVAKELEEAGERHALSERADAAERNLTDVNKQLAVSRASEESARHEIATLSSQLEILRGAFEKQEAELTKVNTGLKNANMKTFAANKQLESWKAESQRTMEQTRVEQEVVLAKLTTEHAKTLEDVRREASEAKALSQAAEKQMALANEKLSLVTHSMDTLEEAERQMQSLRDKAYGARKAALEHATHARKSLVAPASPASPAASPTVSPPTSAKKSPAAPPPAVQAAKPAAAAPSPAASAGPSSVTSSGRAPAPSPSPTVSPGPASRAPVPGDRADQKSEAPLIEFGEIEMGADELVEDLILAKAQASKS